LLEKYNYKNSLGVQTLGHGPTVGSPWSPSTPPSLERGRVAPPPPWLHGVGVI